MEPGEVRSSGYRYNPCEQLGPSKVTARKPRLALTGLVVLVLVCIGGAATAPAKDKRPEVKTVSGVVSDGGDQLIQGAMIELKDLQTGKVLDSYSQAGGQYQFTDLRFDHDYTVQATYNNVSSEVRQVSSIDMRARLTLNLTISKTNK